MTHHITGDEGHESDESHEGDEGHESRCEDCEGDESFFASLSLLSLCPPSYFLVLSPFHVAFEPHKTCEFTTGNEGCKGHEGHEGHEGWKGQDGHEGRVAVCPPCVKTLFGRLRLTHLIVNFMIY